MYVLYISKVANPSASTFSDATRPSPITMSLLKYFSKVDKTIPPRRKYPQPPPGLPDPNGIASTADAELCAAANDSIEKAVPSTKRKRKREDYNDYSEEDRLKMAIFAIENGPAKAARHFTATMGRPVNESSIRWIRDKYRTEMKKKLYHNDAEPLKSLPKEKRGCPTLMPAKVDQAVQDHLQRIRDGGGVVNNRIVIATGQGVLSKYGGAPFLHDEDIKTSWARSMMRRMSFVKRKGTKAARKTPENVNVVTGEFVQRVVKECRDYNIPGMHIIITSGHFIYCLFFLPYLCSGSSDQYG